MITITNVSGSGKIFVGGKEIQAKGRNLEIRDGGIFIDGVPIEEFKEEPRPVLKVEITGNVETIQTDCGDVTVNGRVGSVTSKNGNVEAQTVVGNVLSKNGNVVVTTCQGDCETKNGNIIRNNYYPSSKK